MPKNTTYSRNMWEGTSSEFQQLKNLRCVYPFLINVSLLRHQQAIGQPMSIRKTSKTQGLFSEG